MSKAERLMHGESLMTHAMVLTAVNIEVCSMKKVECHCMLKLNAMSSNLTQYMEILCAIFSSPERMLTMTFFNADDTYYSVHSSK